MEVNDVIMQSKRKNFSAILHYSLRYVQKQINMEFYLSATSIIPDKIRDAVNAIKIFAHEVIVRLDTKTVIFYAGYNFILVNEIIFPYRHFSSPKTSMQSRTESDRRSYRG